MLNILLVSLNTERFFKFCILQGTIVLWVCWPSFNAVLVEGVARHRAIVNTYYAIVTSCVTSCAFSSLMTKESKLSMVSAASDNFQLSRQNSFTTFIFVLINIPYTICMFLKKYNQLSQNLLAPISFAAYSLLFATGNRTLPA